MNSILRFILQTVVVSIITLIVVFLFLPDFIYEKTVYKSTSENQFQDSYVQAVHASAPAVVNIYTRQKGFGYSRTPYGDTKREGRGLGSGVIITKDGYIVTNNHVVRQANSIP